MRRVGVVLLVATIGIAIALASRGSGPVTDGARVQHLSEQLRCPVCDGLAVADSPSSTSRAIEADVRRRVEAGETDDEIRAAYVARYGSWILLDPPARGFGALLWFLPVATVVGGAGFAAWTLRRRGLRAVTAP